jgi:hypothetical protein
MNDSETRQVVVATEDGLIHSDSGRAENGNGNLIVGAYNRRYVSGG